MSKFEIKLNGGAPGAKASVSAGATVTATIDNTAGFSSFAWSIVGTDETTDWAAVHASIVTSGSKSETATFVVGADGSAVIIQAIADGGIDQRTGSFNASLIATAKAFVPAANGGEVIAVNERYESDPTFAYGGPVNSAIRQQNSIAGINDAQHGSRSGGTLHALAEPSVGGVGGKAGFMSAADKAALDNASTTYLPLAGGTLTGPLVTAQLRASGHGELVAGTDAALNAGASQLTLRGRAGVKIQVNDATTPATVRTPLEVIREATGVGEPDEVHIVGNTYTAGNVTQFSAMDIFGVMVAGAVEFNVFPDHISIAGAQLSLAVATSAEVVATTKTFDASTGNVHVASFSSGTTCTVSLSNTKAGAEMEFFLSKAGSGVGVTLSPTWFNMSYADGASNVIDWSPAAGKTLGYVRGRVLTDGGKLFVTEARAL